MMTIKGKRRELENKAASLITCSLRKTIRKKGLAVLAVSGGQSVRGIFELLTEKKILWQKVHIFIIDERFVSFSDKNSNYKLIYNSLIKNYL